MCRNQNFVYRWGNYRDDKTLIDTLKDVAFVPYWNRALPIGNYTPSNTSSSSSSCSSVNPSASSSAAAEHLDFSMPPRRSSELFSWTNDELLSVLDGRLQPNYVAPSQLRTGEMHVMLTDLGMMKELKSANFLKVATDIQGLAAEESEESKLEAASYSRRLLRYLRDESRALDILDQDLARKLRKIVFVPAQKFVRAEAGCHFVFESEICSFEQVMIRSKGPLAFTQYRMLDDDISPPQHFASSLGITVEPKTEVVLKHVSILTHAGETIDRWNHPLFDADKTFAEIFRFLADNWNSVPNNEKVSLRTRPLIPVGHYLVPPSRLFFRLSEDLSPFMHEVPRLYGPHEQFLKKIGVKESPSAVDYSQFLRDLAHECRSSPLNPNELRAVIAIVEIIANQRSDVSSAVGEDAGTANSEAIIMDMLHVPDELSILRRVSSCVISDDSYLRKRMSTGVEQHGYFMLHASLDVAVAAVLQVPKLSTIVVERLRLPDSSQPSSRLTPSATSTNARPMKPSDNEYALQSRFREVFKSEAFLYSLFQLVIDSAASSNGTAITGKDGESSAKSSNNLSSVLEMGAVGIANRLESLQLRFVDSLPTVLVLLDRKFSPPREIELANTSNMGSPNLCFLDYRNRFHTIYINCSAVQAPVTVEIALAVGLCKYLSLSPSVVSTLGTLLTASGTASANLMAALGVGRDASSLRELLRGSPGEAVASSDHALLELKPFRIFRAGEVVAYDHKVMVATNLGNAAVGAAMDMRYGRVVSCGESEEGGLRRVTVKTGSGTVAMLSTDVYSFKSAREAATAGSVSAHSSSSASSATAGQNPIGKAARPAPSALGTESAPPDSAPLAAGSSVAPVQRDELLSAVSGLMQRAGIPLGADTQVR
jgi:hypothetical protein